MTPLSKQTYTVEDLAELSMDDKLKMMHEGLVDNYIMLLQAGGLHPRDMAPMMTLLKNNDIKEKPEELDTMHQKVLKALDEKK